MGKLRATAISILLWSDVALFVGLSFAVGVWAPRTWIWFLGMAIAAGGFICWMIARFQLGRAFTATAQARQLVTKGLYRRFRHPIYLFGGLAHFGVFLAFQNVWILVCWACYATLIQRARMRREDEVLEEAFGDAFIEHRKDCWI